MNKACLPVLLAVLSGVVVLAPLGAQQLTSEGTGPSEKAARRNADSKLEYQFEVSIKTVAALSNIVEEHGQSMKFDPAADLAIFPTSSVGLAGLDYKLKPRKTNEAYRVVASLDPVKAGPLYIEGLARLRNEISTMHEAALNAPAMADSTAILEELLVFVKEYRVYRNLAILLGFTAEPIPFSPVPERDVAFLLETRRHQMDSLDASAAAIAALVLDSGVFVGDVLDMKQKVTPFGTELKTAVTWALKAKKIKAATSLSSAKTVLKMVYFPVRQSDGSLERLELQARLVSLQRSDSGQCRRSAVLSVLPAAVEKLAW